MSGADMNTYTALRFVTVAICGLAGTNFAIAADEVSEGKQIFRFDTFGDEQLWTDKLGLHKVVQTSVDPTTALKVGLKVDSEVLPPGTLEKADLKDPATTVALLKLNAVVGLKAEVDANNQITKLGVTCALWMTRCRRASASGWMAGRIVISTWARSSRCRRR
jgi:hypothetical protein